MIAQDDIEDLKQRLDPVDVLEWIGYEKSHPKRSGGQIRDFCPFHEGDRQQSLAINEASGEFVCHACGVKGGDLIQLYGKAKGLENPKDFPKLIEELQRLSGTLPRQEHQKKREPQQKSDEELLTQSRAIAEKIWQKAAETGDTSYFEAKGLKPPAGIRYGQDENGNPCAIVPFYDIKGSIQAIQYVQKGSKLFASGSKTSGALFPFGWNFGNAPKIAYLAEGIATACSVFESLKKATPVLSCGSVSNISKVVKALSDEHPDAKLVVCLDDDHTADKTRKEIEALNIRGVSFRKPDFTGIDRNKDEKGKILDKDFDDLRRLAGSAKVAEQLSEEFLSAKDIKDRDVIMASGLVDLRFVENYFQNLPSGIDIGLKTGSGDHDKILLPSGGYTVFCAPTKHGKTAALVNAVDRHLSKDPKATAVFISLEELEPPIMVRFVSRFINETLSRSNFNTLTNFFRSKSDPFSMFSLDWKRADPDGEDPKILFRKNLGFFDEKYLKSGRLRIFSFNSFGGCLSQIESLCQKIKELKKWLPELRLVAIDYLQLLGMQKAGNKSRDEVLKEVCLQLKDLAASTGLSVVTAAQFNRTIQNEDDLHASQIGEGGSIERHAALAIGMWNRKFQQFSAGKPDKNKTIRDEILLNVLLNRHGESSQKLVAPYNGNIGLIDFESAKIESASTKQTKAPKQEERFAGLE